MPSPVTNTTHPIPNRPADRREPLSIASAAVGAVAAGDTIALQGSSSVTLDGAARDALRRANPLSITDNVEYGGKLYHDPQTNTFGATAPVRGAATSFDPRTVTIPPGTRVAGDYHTHGDYSKKGANGEPKRTGNLFNDAYGSHKFSKPDIDGITHDALGRSGYAGYLGTPGGDHLKYDPSRAETTSLHSTSHATAGGALTGAAAGAALSTASALRRGHMTRDDVRTIAKNTIAGAGVGAVAGGIERYATPLTDRVAGHTVARVASALGNDAASSLARTAVSRIGGATVAGTVASIGISAYENREGLARGDSTAIGNVAGDAAVGLGSALTGAAAGAAIGSVVPVAGTIVGAGVGLVAGYAADKIMRAGGVDTFVSHAVANGIDDVKGALAR